MSTQVASRKASDLDHAAYPDSSHSLLCSFALLRLPHLSDAQVQRAEVELMVLHLLKVPPHRLPGVAICKIEAYPIRAVEPGPHSHQPLRPPLWTLQIQNGQPSARTQYTRRLLHF